MRSKISGKERPVVLITIPRYLPNQGGGPLYFSTLIEHLKDRVDFIVLTQKIKGEKTIEKKDNVWIYRKQPFLDNYPSLIKWAVIPPLTCLYLLVLWKKYRPVIHAHSNGIYGFVSSLFSLILNIDMIKEVQDLSDPPYYTKFGKVKTFSACGSTVEERLIEYGVPKNKIHTYPALNPPSVRRYIKEHPPKKRRDGPVKILFVGWISRRVKGVDILLESFKIVQGKLPDAELTVIGDGPDMGFCEDFIARNGLKNVKLTGNLSYEETIEHIANTDIIAQPSREEAFGRVVLEGFQFRKPTVAHKIDHLAITITHGKNGMLVEPGKPEDFAAAIIELAQNSKLRDKLGKRGFDDLKKYPGWDELADDMYQLYIDIYNEWR